LGIKRNAYELFWGILIFLPGESKSLKKRLVDLSFSTGTVKEKGRGEEKFRVFKTGNCPFFFYSIIRHDLIDF